MLGLGHDLRYAVRQLRRSPGFTAAAVLTLALGIGVNATVFSVVNAFLFRPLPVENGRELVAIGCRHESGPALHGLSYEDYRDVREQVSGLSGVVAYAMGLPGFASEGRAERVISTYVTANYFEVLGVPATVGRVFASGDHEGQGATPHVVLGHRFWKRRFGGDPGVLGRSVTLNGQPLTVVGVVPESFRGAYAIIEPDLYALLGTGIAAGEVATGSRDAHDVHVLGRLAPGSSLKTVGASLGVLASRLAAEHPATNKDVTFEAVPEPLARPEENNADSAPLVAGVFSALVGLVLLVACANVANLLLVRATARAQEFGVRAALGASASRLRRQLLTETLLLALLGGLAGAGLGALGASALSRVRLPNLPIVLDFAMDWRVFGVVAAAAAVSAFVAGLAPAWRASRTDLVSALREGGRSGVEGRHRLRDLLVVGQVAVCVVLLVSAGLFTRSLEGSRRLDLGFDPQGVVNAGLNVAQLGYDEARGRAFYEELERRVSALPGVESAALGWSIPIGYYSMGVRAASSTGLLGDKQAAVAAGMNRVSSGYFKTMGVHLLGGRPFTEADTKDGARVAVINEELARRLWPGQSPLGRSVAIDFGDGKTPPFMAEVVGLTPTGRYQQITEAPQPYVYLPFSQWYHAQRVFHLKTSGSPDAILRAVPEAVRDLDPGLAVYDLSTMETSLEGANGYFLFRAAALLTGILGALGLVLSLVGVYGVVSFAAARRTREIGVRIALGARPLQIAHLVVGHSLALAGSGLVVGALAAFAASRALRGLLFGVAPGDPRTFLGVAALLILTVVAATLWPALRAARVDPMIALRSE